ncbi:MAG: hypothetical protein RL186_571 [Pseudomonadota bacterium]|jgi:RNA polymerase sigma factor (TIGR02999 family)
MTESSKPPREPAAFDGALAQTLYQEMHRSAHLAKRRSGFQMTLQTTAVLHEAYIKLANKQSWESRAHFLASASTAMRHILVDAARARLAEKRGGGQKALPLSETPEVLLAGQSAPMSDHDLAALGDALKQLQHLEPELANLVDCRFFAGMTEAETAQALGMSERTVRRKWLRARAFIHHQLRDV